MEDSNIANNIQNLFPEPVYRISLRDPTKKELKYIKSLDKKNNQGNRYSVNNYVLEEPELSSLKDDILIPLKQFYQIVSQHHSNTGLRVTQSWCNYTKEDQFHHPHLHPNSIISGVYYPQAEEGVDRIMFHKNMWHQNHRVEPTAHNVWNSETWWFPVKTGDLILFNSSLRHEVPRKGKSKKQRISLSFNTFHTGTVGHRDALTEVIFNE